MEVIARHGREDLAMLYVGKTGAGSLLEFVESVAPPTPREEKWVLIISTLKGCPVRCSMCDAGGNYQGPLSTAEILEQIDFMVTARYPNRIIPIPKFKVQFARMGEPTLNDAVFEVLQDLPQRYNAPGLMPCISTVLPRGRERFFKTLKNLKDSLYPNGRFQLQFSLHTTDSKRRRRLINYPVMDFGDAAAMGENFHRPGDRKIALNFAAAKGYPIDPEILIQHFDPSVFLVKITPLNPTERVRVNGLRTQINPADGQGSSEIVDVIRQAGYEVILSLGEPEEDVIGSNCGQYVNRYRPHQEVTPV